ncbi:unnamed protein product [Tuber melanosporum]|uniref:(Perigord truffle) hypothetical protein n=1 Tax=Tuber melanosporum (strain Mel28) TaxID=656061 RepID=D5G4U5_TUBMM|nr:uncharacterized protein GSTUM_00000203001 [Tuber melanosporum]CAZ79538.1 unnamed protein product [Tuber melanosporum]
MDKPPQTHVVCMAMCMDTHKKESSGGGGGHWWSTWMAAVVVTTIKIIFQTTPNIPRGPSSKFSHHQEDLPTQDHAVSFAHLFKGSPKYESL